MNMTGGRWIAAAAMAAAALVANVHAADGGRMLVATLTGAAEVPGPGDPDGTGSAAVAINVGQREVCFLITVSGITLPATAAHIHEGVAGEAGDAIVTLSPPAADGMASGCVSANRDDLVDILRAPSAFYVNVHTTDFGAGAIRGQLSKR